MPRLEHIGIAVRQPDDVAALYETLLEVLPYKTETVADQGVRTHFISAETAKLELLEAIDDDSPIAGFLNKRGEGLHHLAFEVDDIDAAFERLQNASFTPLGDGPSRGADGKRIFFLHPKQTHGVLVELCQSVPMELEPVSLPFEDHTLAAYERGRRNAPTILLLHGAAGSTALETAPLLRRLEPHAHVLAVDFSGHGASDPAEDLSFSADLFAANARATLDHFDVDQADVFGFSMGGSMALHLAHRHPERVRRIAVHGANLQWPAERVEALTRRLDVAHIAAHAPLLADQFASTHADWRGLFTRMARFIRTLPDVEAQMHEEARSLSHPTLVSTVDADDLFPLDAALHLHETLPNSRLTILPGTHHALRQINEDVLAPLLLEHVGAA